MKFNYIINPQTGKSVSIYSITGKKVLYNYVKYLQKGAKRRKSKKKIKSKKNGKKQRLKKKYIGGVSKNNPIYCNNCNNKICLDCINDGSAECSALDCPEVDINPKTGRKIQVGGVTYNKVFNKTGKTFNKLIAKGVLNGRGRGDDVMEGHYIAYEADKERESEQKDRREWHYNKNLYFSGQMLNKLIGNEDIIIKEFTSKDQKFFKRIKGGTAHNELTGILYLLFKHKNDCYPLEKEKITRKLFGENITFSDYILSAFGVETIHFLDYSIEVQIIKESNRNKYEIKLPDNFKKQWEKCVNTTKRFIFILCAIYKVEIIKRHWMEALWNDRKVYDHAGCLIFDSKTKELERFEPHGLAYFYNNDYVDKILNLKLRPIIKHTDYHKPLNFCPAKSFQRYPSPELTGVDPGGFCMYWTIWYMDIRLSNPDIKRDDIVRDSINKIIRKHDDPSATKLVAVDFGQFIRSYAIFLNVINNYIINIVKQFNIEKKKEDDPRYGQLDEHQILSEAFNYLIKLFTTNEPYVPYTTARGFQQALKKKRIEYETNK